MFFRKCALLCLLKLFSCFANMLTVSYTPYITGYIYFVPFYPKKALVRYPAELSLVGYQTSRTMAELCTFYSRGLFCGVWYPAEQHSAGPDTPPNKVLRGIRPRIIKFCGVSDPREQLLNTNISANQNRIQKYFRVVWIWDDVYGVNSWKKTRGRKSCACVPLNGIPRSQLLEHF